MFADSKKVRAASLAALTAAVLLVAPSALALEGIQGRHVIFYPSLELVYQHDDNFFLTPDNEISADTFLTKAHFALEFPGARQYLRMEYAPQYRNVSVSRGSFDLDDKISHYWELDAKLRGSSIFGVNIHQDLVVGSLETNVLDENRGDLNEGGGERFTRHDIAADFVWEGSQQGVILKVGHSDTSFDDINTAPPWFELNELQLGTEYFYKFTPLTRFFVGWEYRDGEQDYTTKLTNLTGIRNLESTRHDVYAGFQGELGRTTTGRAQVGFLSLDYDGTNNPSADFDGVSVKADVTKSFSRYSKLAFGAERSTNQSGFESNTYYVANRVGVTFSNQPGGRRVGWTLAGGFQRNTYDTAEDDVTDPSPLLREREDDVSHLRAEIGYHAIEHLSLRLNYRFEERESSFNNFDYTDNLVIFQVQFGF